MSTYLIASEYAAHKTISPEQPILIDTVSCISSTHVSSGLGGAPDIRLKDFGESFDHSQSLMMSNELMLYDNRFQMPFSRDYSKSLPSGPDYSNVLDTCSIRYATFSLKYKSYGGSTTALIRFSDIQGDGWGSNDQLAMGMTLQIRCFNDTGSHDSGWLDANKYYDPFSVSANESEFGGCLLAARTTEDTKHVKLNLLLDEEMQVYIRIGFASDEVYKKSFRDVSVLSTDKFDQSFGGRSLTIDTTFFSAASVLNQSVSHNITHDDEVCSRPYEWLASHLDTLEATLITDDEITETTSLDLRTLEGADSKAVGLISASIQNTLTNPRIKVRLKATNSLPVFKRVKYMLTNLSSSTGRKSISSVPFRVDPTTAPFLQSQPSFFLSENMRYISGVPSILKSTKLTAMGEIAGAVTNYYNCAYGPASVGGKEIGFRSAKDCNCLPISAFESPFRVIITSDFLSNKICENILVCIRLYAPDGSVSEQNLQLFPAQTVRIDTISAESHCRIKSGWGTHPISGENGFGLLFDETESLAVNQDLQLCAGKYQLPLELDYSANYPSGPNYSNINTSLTMRYVTFQHTIECISGCTIRFYDAEGEGWGTATIPASGMTLQIKVGNDMFSTGWLDANSFWDGFSDTIEDGDACLLSLGTRSTDKRVIFSRPVFGTCYIRVGLNCDCTLKKKFRTIVVDCETQVVCLHSEDYHEMISDVDASSEMSNKQLQTALDEIWATDRGIRRLCTTVKDRDMMIYLRSSFYKCTSIVTGECHDNIITDRRPTTNFIKLDGCKSICAYCDCNERMLLTGSVSIQSLTPGVETRAGNILSVVNLKNIADNPESITSACMRPSGLLSPGDDEFSFLMTKDSFQHGNLLSFRIDNPVEPEKATSVSFTFDEESSFISGIKTPTSGSQISATFVASGCVSYYINERFGIASIDGECIQQASEKNQRSFEYSTLKPGCTLPVTLKTSFVPRHYTEKAIIHINLYNSIGFKQTISFDNFLSNDLRLDTASLPIANQVFSGYELYPNIVLVDFGTAYDHTASLMTRPELQLINGSFRVPISADYSKSLPSGSPDYSLVDKVFDIRYSTFAFKFLKNTSNAVIFFEGIQGHGWGSDGRQADELYLQMRVINSERDTLWLDANQFYDPSIDLRRDQSNGQPCLISSRSAAEKFVTFGSTICSGTIYIRVGIPCSSLLQKQFSNVFCRTDEKYFDIFDKHSMIS